MPLGFGAIGEYGIGSEAPVDNLTSTNLAVSAPVFGAPNYAVGLNTSALAVSSPVLGIPVAEFFIGETIYDFLYAVSLNVESPEIGVPRIAIKAKSVPIKNEMVDVRIQQNFNFAQPLWDWVVRSDTHQLDEREVLATAVRVALGTDRLADEDIILPDPDSTDRRGWWGDMDAESIWEGWPIGTKNWVLTRAKITEAPSEEGSTLERARLYTLEALQPFIDRGIASQVEVDAVRTELHRIEVTATIYRGPEKEIDLTFQPLWTEPAI